MGTTDEVWSALREAGWAAKSANPPPSFLNSPEPRDILPDVRMSWPTEARPDWLVDGVSRGAALTVGIPRPHHAAVGQWLGARLAWWPQGVPAGRWIGLLSSRLGRELDLRHEWFAVLRAACGKVDRQQSLIVTATGTTTAKYVERCSVLFDTPALHIHTPNKREQLVVWLKRILSDNHTTETPPRHHVFLSPPMNDANPSVTHDAEPDRDRAIAALCDELLVLQARPNGVVDRLVRQRLADDTWPQTSVFIALGEGLSEKRLAGELMDLGAVGWVVQDTLTPPAAASFKTSSPQSKQGSTNAPIIPMPSQQNWDFLSHFTRRRHGPWPDQHEHQFVDDLIVGREEADHSPLAALRRILSQQRIIASADTIRGGFRVVSFTAAPLSKLNHLRVFRPHRGRWDFEPYGICLRKDWLLDHSARPVIYGDDSTWNDLSPADQPFFQMAATRRDDTDWTIEQEWRHLGDVDLSQLPPDAGIVVVPSEEEAEQLAPQIRWPIVVLNATE